MVFEAPLQMAGKAFRLLNPRNWSKPHPNFITVHYMYIIGCSIIGSIMIFPAGGMAYIDALFFTSGASTQAGLNTINTNEIKLYQQVVLFLIACIANPIFINSSVVFVRLYWFEKKFHHIAQEAKSRRGTRTRTISRNGSQMKDILDPARLERGVNGREIRVLHDTTTPNGMSGPTIARMSSADKDVAEKLGLSQESRSVSPTPESSNRASNHSDEVAVEEKDHADFETAPQTPAPETPQARSESWMGLNPGLRREITFADELPTPQVPESQDLERHIRFRLKQQSLASEKVGTLRIPGPRDFDRGEMPEEVDADDRLQRPLTRDTSASNGDAGAVDERARAGRLGKQDEKAELNADDHPPRAITFNEPDHPATRGRFRNGGDAANDDDDADSSHAGFRHTLSKVKTNLTHATHRRHHSRSRSRGAGPHLQGRNSMAKTFNSITTARTRASMDVDPMPYLSWQATIGRNSAFLGLSQAQREELGGIEYRALKTLALILICYYVGFHLLGMIIYLPWILHGANHAQGYLEPAMSLKQYVTSVGTSPAWWGIWTPASMFNDLGFTLTPDSMNSFSRQTVPLLVGSFLIVIGNTGFPCMLRFVIWVTQLFVPVGSGLWEELRFLLDHPRRCFTLLFPSKATWWLFWILAALNIIDLIFFIILDLNGSNVVTELPPGFRVLSGWFQATSTRTAGFSCVNLAGLHPAIQVSYLIMMYISVFPIAISVRRTNVYEEKSLGIWGGEEDNGEGNDAEQSYVGQHLRRQLSFDLWYVFLGFFIICIVEGTRLGEKEDWAFTMFAVLFEIVSAYGTVGLSLGYPTVDSSFSSQFHVLSKLVIIAMMIRGRHRGLPYALDRAILLPSENLHKNDAALERTMTRRMSVLDPHAGDWQDGELDEYGLPKQHSGAMGAMEAGAGGEQNPDGMRRMNRRGSGMTTASHASGREGGVGRPQARSGRRRSVSGVFAGALGAGPTVPRHV